MRKMIWLALALFTGSAMAEDAPKWPTQDGDVTVIWQEPDNYRDVKTGSGVQSRYQNHVFATLGKHMQKKIEPLLAEGETATFTVTDLDLAGDVRPSFGATPNDIRIVKSVYPPRIEFSYEVKGADGSVKVSGEEKLADLGFDTRSVTRYRNDALRYEMQMLDDWISRTLEPQLKP
ncbi:conserved hypothetical protein [Ferrimonas balearica DSM 9799]|uniref:DUF3016 domain-containing protein n=1 Tax=Ferrimonas balearica (strain DSM 9799 / CCM 4581 / KCTC 23876 / PAT) TaxID=550540 RepID=E1SP52_FERBD|nr:DUF3016 domain-containing protein [Ferrimonas balearica]MBY6018657.1 DUF3016 domain-containing protein [Halomonas denitrificans]ADN74701.1 conserved hypothetical protein [Ferrimonas balearica DSM 9799]MBW3140492.1 DUF3016 domain-containing protein [Ferrimonas balearica]MBW3165514.1 DUF3016 domain-containing protein [Ferrimonas balearica]MBY5981272.1 DUF3016 domain-containing protein [Ferrimonas balearica]